MAGYRKLDETQYAMYVGRTARLYHEGKTAEDIAKAIKRPLHEVKEFIEYVKIADKVRAERETN